MSHAPHQAVRRVLVLVVAVTLSWNAAAGAAEPDAGARRREVQKQQAEVASRIDGLRASDAELEVALDDIDANIRSQVARTVSAEQTAAVAAQEVQRAKEAAARTAQELGALRVTMKAWAVESYVKGPSRQLSVAVGAASLSELVTRQQMVGAVTSKGADTADRLRATREDLAVELSRAEEAQVRAVASRRAMEDELAELGVAQAAQERLSATVEQRLEQSLAEAASLQELDRKLAAEIAERARLLAAQAASRRAAAAAATAAAAAAARSTPAAPVAPARTQSAPPRPVGSSSITTVRGIAVTSEIAGNVERLLIAASADGFDLGGGGYRSSDGQIATRRSNCGTSNYDIYDKPASACSPPTARPGESMHEKGLAVDFTSNGQLIQGRSDPAFGWLARNAGRFGFYNLPREPWHWSTNGN